MSRSLSFTVRVWLALFVAAAPGAGRSASADEVPSPLAAMRAAAQALADVEPGPPPALSAGNAKKALIQHAPPTESRGKDALQAAMRQALSVEVSRDLAARERPIAGRSDLSNKTEGGIDSAQEARDQTRGAALQAQGAKVVGTQHSQSIGKGPGKPLGIGSSGGSTAVSSGAIRLK